MAAVTMTTLTGAMRGLALSSSSSSSLMTGRDAMVASSSGRNCSAVPAQHQQQQHGLTIEAAHKKGAGSPKHGRDSKPKMLAINIYGNQPTQPGAIIIRQRGTKLLRGKNVGLGRDGTIYSLIDGLVKFKKYGPDRKKRLMSCTGFLKPRGSPATNATQVCRRRALRCRASWGEETSKSEYLDACEEIELDSSVFEEVYPSVRKVVKPAGTRVRGMPIPQSTLIPDDWKDVQQYLHRGKKERKQETLALQMEWAKRRALEDRLTRQELRDDRQRGEDLVSGGAAVVSGDEGMASQVEDLETGVGISSNVVSARARPKDFRSELQLSSVEEIAQTLGRNEEVESTSQDSEDVDTPRVIEKKPLLTAEERAILKNKNLNFARVSSNKWNPLHTLAAAGQVYLAAELLKRAVELDAVDSDGLTPLHRAVQAGEKTMARMLLKAGANAQVLDNNGATLLHYSAQNGNQDISKLLIRHGVDVNTADEDGWTPLHVAVQSGRLILIKALVYRGANVSIASKDGKTALDLALAFGGCFNFYDAIKFLKKVSVLDSQSTFPRDEDRDEGDDESN